MSSLSVYHHSNPDVPDKLLTHGEDIAATLASVGVAFERCSGSTPVQPGSSREQVLEALGAQLDELMSERGYSVLDVVSLDTARSYQEEVAASVLEEQCNGDSEAYWFVAGRGLVNLHVGDYVYAVLCERGDLISLPAGTRYWFDMGAFPRLIALCLRQGTAETCATGDAIASRFPRLED
ncbi:acireductone dioxygenase [Pseudomonas sp. BMS12]|uniref:acireductone dioxygenase n=1 Tax=Pseudomonas sp. BMS12 TaxID=1796033 RepID=UPI00083A537F|nr:acireductone dioxygenase [Pseudomonas sp. BMS12]